MTADPEDEIERGTQGRFMPPGAPGAMPDPERLFADIAFSGQQNVCVAVSGGGDSLALLLLLKNHFERVAGAPGLIGLTVDHGLRPEAAAEARAVARLCAKRGIAHRTLRWEGRKPKAGVAAAARAARFDLLAAAARAAGATTVLTGHTLDDQAETLTMRLRRGGGRGEAGIAPATAHDDGSGATVWFLRPLLRQRRAALRRFLQRAGVGWIEDPSNDDPAFERVRVRRDLDDDAATALSQRADSAAATRTELGARAARLIETHARRVAPGLYRVAPALLSSDDQEAAQYAFRLLAAMVGGRAQLGSQARASAMFARVAGGFCATLSRSVVDVRDTDIYLYRERRNLPREAPPRARPDLWDGRYWIGAPAPCGDAAVAPMGRAAAWRWTRDAGALPQDLVLAAQSAEPAIWRAGECHGPAAGTPGFAVVPAAAPWARLMPVFDLAAARALAALCGARAVSPPPSARHERPQDLT